MTSPLLYDLYFWQRISPYYREKFFSFLKELAQEGYLKEKILNFIKLTEREEMDFQFSRTFRASSGNRKRTGRKKHLLRDKFLFCT